MESLATQYVVAASGALVAALGLAFAAYCAGFAAGSVEKSERDGH